MASRASLSPGQLPTCCYCCLCCCCCRLPAATAAAAAAAAAADYLLLLLPPLLLLLLLLLLPPTCCCCCRPQVGAKSSGAKVKVFKHNDAEHLDRVLRSSISEGQPRTGRGKRWASGFTVPLLC